MSGTGTPDTMYKPPDRRKLIAVVYADMVCYGRLIGLDDVGTLERLRTLRSTLIDPTIAEHGARIVNTGGDSLLTAGWSDERSGHSGWIVGPDDLPTRRRSALADGRPALDRLDHDMHIPIVVATVSARLRGLARGRATDG
jgi:class 3 adenylate cyclase